METVATDGTRRWYPTVLTLGDGRVIAVSGRGADGKLDRVPEIFTRGKGWRALRSPGLLPWSRTSSCSTTAASSTPAGR